MADSKHPKHMNSLNNMDQSNTVLEASGGSTSCMLKLCEEMDSTSSLIMYYTAYTCNSKAAIQQQGTSFVIAVVVDYRVEYVLTFPAKLCISKVLTNGRSRRLILLCHLFWLFLF